MGIHTISIILSKEFIIFVLTGCLNNKNMWPAMLTGMHTSEPGLAFSVS